MYLAIENIIWSYTKKKENAHSSDFVLFNPSIATDCASIRCFSFSR